MFTNSRVICFFILSCMSSIAYSEAKHITQQTAPELIEALKSGGHILYMRHGSMVFKGIITPDDWPEPQ